MKPQKGRLQHPPIAADKRGSWPSYFPPITIVWIAALVFSFFYGNHLGKRAPRPDYLSSLIDLLSYSGSILADGLAANILFAAGIWLIFWMIGDAIYRATSLHGATKLERLALSTGLGSGFASLAMLGIGMLERWNPMTLKAGFFLAAVCSIGILLWRSLRIGTIKDASDAILPVAAQSSLLAYLALLPIASAILLSLLATAGPETFFDSLVYHLALPKLYLLHGGISPTPHNLYSGFPFGLEMLYGLALAISNENLAILLHCSFGWLAVLGLALWLRRHSSRDAAVLGTLIFLLSPVVLHAGWQSGVDLGTTFYISLALTSTSLALESQATSRRWSLISGIYLGLALGTKYTALPLCAAFICVHAWRNWRMSKSISDSVWMIVAASLTFLPWALKNTFFYGNPVYPFFHDFMGFAAPAQWDMFLGDAHSRNIIATMSSAGGWKELLLLPWAVTVDPYVVYRISLGYLILLPWALSALVDALKIDSMPTALKHVGAISLLAGMAWALTSTIARFLIPTLLIWAALLAACFARSEAPQWLRRSTWTLLIMFSTCNLIAVYLEGASSLSGKWDVLKRLRGRDEYLRDARGGYGQPPYAAMEFINQNLPENSRVLFLGETRGFYSEREFVAATVFDDNPFWIAARKSATAHALRAKLAESGITHIFVNAFLLYSYSDIPSVLPRELASQHHVTDFWSRYLRPVHEIRDSDSAGRIRNWLLVYELKDPANVSGDNRSNPINDVLATLKHEGR